ncbi:hypothetical protein J2Y46_000933 [Microbacterium sp. BE35]|uniref:MarR family transcriptional regulator n=1 Tax=Microbacterium sp. BE35 TaxID=2817773 RepID=UPI002858C026|nr:MarR family transcriptional regulator [Microbacterium sp. BE35]MDR7188117.1 hypothetical protein [Microbacterium sp. BE35]
MDTISTVELSRRLGVSLPTAHTLLDAAGVPRVGRGYSRSVPVEVVDALIAMRGVTPRSERSSTELRILAALLHAEEGLPSARAVAVRAGVSPTTASRAIERLVADALLQDLRHRLPGSLRVVRRIEVMTFMWSDALTRAVNDTRLPTLR